MPAPTGYSQSQIMLHWATVVAVVAQFVLHEPIAEAFDAGLETGDFGFSAGVIVHFALGLLILGLAAVRLLIRKDRGTPPPPEGEPLLFQRLSHIAHLAFYAVLLLLPLTGVVAWGGESAVAGAIHEVLRAVLILLILSHVGAVVVHQFVWKTGLLRRMVTPGD